MEAAKPDCGGASERGGCGDAAVSSGVWAAVSSADSPVVHWNQRATRCVLVGLLAGALSALLTISVYAVEDAFQRLKIHWMWWPAMGGLAIGLGGLVFPQALGVGYDTIGALLQGSVTTRVILGVLLVKWFIWAVSLGSGTSGGVLAPLLMMGGALGGLEAMFLPNEGAGFWPLISMGAILGGTMRAPFTSMVFAFELTHDANVFLPLLVSSVIAHGFTVVTLKRSILTEKVARRGFHLSREYAVDPLEILFVREVMRTKVVVLPAASTLGEIWHSLRVDHSQEQRLLPVVSTGGQLVGVVTRGDISERIERHGDAALGWPIGDLVRTSAFEPYPEEPLRVVVYRMAEKGCTRMPVVERDTKTFLGLVSLNDLLKARSRHLEEESRRERSLNCRLFPPGKRNPKET